MVHLGSFGARSVFAAGARLTARKIDITIASDQPSGRSSEGQLRPGCVDHEVVGSGIASMRPLGLSPQRHFTEPHVDHPWDFRLRSRSRGSNATRTPSSPRCKQHADGLLCAGPTDRRCTRARVCWCAWSTSRLVNTLEDASGDQVAADIGVTARWDASFERPLRAVRLGMSRILGTPEAVALRLMAERAKQLFARWEDMRRQDLKRPACVTRRRPFAGSARVHLFAFSGPRAIAGSCLAGAGQRRLSQTGRSSSQISGSRECQAAESSAAKGLPVAFGLSEPVCQGIKHCGVCAQPQVARDDFDVFRVRPCRDDAASPPHDAIAATVDRSRGHGGHLRFGIAAQRATKGDDVSNHLRSMPCKQAGIDTPKTPADHTHLAAAASVKSRQLIAHFFFDPASGARFRPCSHPCTS